jgi:hypothetical protein
MQQSPLFNEDCRFLQDWLENRYGAGFAQAVMDDLESQTAEQITLPYDPSGMVTANDNQVTTPSPSRKAS